MWRSVSLVGSMFVLLATDDATSVRIQDLDFRVIPVSEPGSLALVAAALLALQRRRPGAVRSLNRA